MTNNQPPPYTEHFQNYGERIWHYVLDPLLRLFADQDIVFFGRLRRVIAAIIIIACLTLIFGVFWKPTKFINAAGLMFDIAGVLRLFLLERIHAETSPFWDAARYPNGPPSVVMRELIMPEATLYADTRAPHMSRFYYINRGIFFLVIGFILQLIADLIA